MIYLIRVMKSNITLLLFISLSLSSCVKTDPVENEPIVVTDFSGTWIMNVDHTILNQTYDSIGNNTGIQYITTQHVDTVQINRVGTTNQFDCTDLRYGYSKLPSDALSINDSLVINNDWSDATHRRYIKGKFELQNDGSLIIDYNWDNFDTWSTGATPFNGHVVGTANKL